MRRGKLPHPDAFTQAPTCCPYFSYHFAGILLSVWETYFLPKQTKNGIWNSRSPVCPRCSGPPWCCPHGCLPQTRFLGDTGSRGAPPIGVSSALALSFTAVSIGGIWAMALYCALQHTDIFSVVLQTEDVESLLFHSRLKPSSADALVAHSLRSFDRWYTLALLRSARSVPRPVVLHVPALLSRRCRPGR